MWGQRKWPITIANHVLVVNAPCYCGVSFLHCLLPIGDWDYLEIVFWRSTEEQSVCGIEFQTWNSQGNNIRFNINTTLDRLGLLPAEPIVYPWLLLCYCCCALSSAGLVSVPGPLVGSQWSDRVLSYFIGIFWWMLKQLGFSFTLPLLPILVAMTYSCRCSCELYIQGTRAE